MSRHPARSGTDALRQGAAWSASALLGALLILLPRAARAQAPAAPAPARPEDAASAPGLEVEVRATRQAQRDAGAPARRVSGEDIERSARATLLESVALETPGLYVNARGPFAGVAYGGAGGMRLRGLGGSPNTEIVVLEDGVPDQMGLFGHPIPDAYFPAYVGGVRVIPGGDSVLYGNGAMAGVIETRTRWLGHDGHDVRILGELGSYETATLQAGALGATGPWDYLATVRTTHSEGHRAFAGGTETGAIVKARYRITPHVDVTLRQRTLLAHTFDPGTASRPYYDHYVDFDRYNQSVTLTHEHERVSGRVTLYANLGTHQLFDGFRSHDSLFGLWADTLVRPERHTSVWLGLDGRSIGGDGKDLVGNVDYGAHRHALLDPYQQVAVSPWAFLTLVAGAREHLTASAPLLLGKLAAEAELPLGLRVAARYVDNYRDPSVVERFFPFPVANSTLRPERSSTLDATLGWRLRDVVKVELTGYITRAHDYIRSLGAYPVFSLENIESLRLRGLEGLVQVRPVRSLVVGVTGSVTEVGKYSAQTPTRTATGLIVYEVGAWRFELDGMYAGGLYQKDFAQLPLEDPWQLDARVDRVLLDGHLRAWVTGRNLTNHRYAYLYDYPMPGINALAGVEIALF